MESSPEAHRFHRPPSWKLLNQKRQIALCNSFLEPTRFCRRFPMCDAYLEHQAHVNHTGPEDLQPQEAEPKGRTSCGGSWAMTSLEGSGFHYVLMGEKGAHWKRSRLGDLFSSHNRSTGPAPDVHQGSLIQRSSHLHQPLLWQLWRQGRPGGSHRKDLSRNRLWRQGRPGKHLQT
ncbi:hypothetical protein QTO34_005485 [Cnephaeus nilssonii]|uniref:Uncharacterized protein n=1 Tax=Cnephaeus nilssonii TaxID=3371016 RepID=A0AA40HNE6_CNENI|nr:hypothetical protein QTO34_005485 [Eptesicus nilssonii]